MNNILCELRICTQIENTPLFKKQFVDSNNKRLKQYINGILKFRKFNDGSLFDIFVTDNTVSDASLLNKQLLDVIPKNFKIVTSINNNFGCKNKGAGDIEQWIYNIELIKKYKWFIHFEPRQCLINNSFIENFLKNPRNLFKATKNHFYTGIFCIETKHLLEFIKIYTPKYLVDNSIGIEYAIYNYFKKNKINFDTVKSLDLVWHDTFANKDIKL